MGVAALAVGLGAFIQGAVGIGFGLFAAPIVAIVARDLVPGPLLFLGLVLTALVAWRERAGLDLGGVKWAVVGRVPGTLVGSLAVAVLPSRGLSIAIAVVVLVAVALSLSGWRVRRSTAAMLAAGVTSGVMATATSIGGPPMAIVYQDTAGSELRGSLAGFFLFGAAVSLVGLAAFGEFGPGEARDALVLVPALLIGFAVSGVGARYLDRGHTQVAVLAVSALSSVFLLVDELL